MLGTIDDLETDRTASIDGVPLEVGAGRTIWVRRAGGHNRTWALGLAEAAEELDDSLDTEAQGYELNKRVAAERLIARWEGFEDADGNEVQFSAELGRELFDRAPDILQEVLTLAMSRDAYQLAEDKKK